MVPYRCHTNLFRLSQHRHAAPTLIVFSAKVSIGLQTAVSATCTFYLPRRSCYSFQKHSASVNNSVASPGMECMELHIPDVNISLLATRPSCVRAGISQFCKVCRYFKNNTQMYYRHALLHGLFLCRIFIHRANQPLMLSQCCHLFVMWCTRRSPVSPATR
jgi:hypothetical protein